VTNGIGINGRWTAKNALRELVWTRAGATPVVLMKPPSAASRGAGGGAMGRTSYGCRPSESATLRARSQASSLSRKVGVVRPRDRVPATCPRQGSTSSVVDRHAPRSRRRGHDLGRVLDELAPQRAAAAADGRIEPPGALAGPLPADDHPHVEAQPAVEERQRLAVVLRDALHAPGELGERSQVRAQVRAQVHAPPTLPIES
jgi:hypothetical protein